MDKEAVVLMLLVAMPVVWVRTVDLDRCRILDNGALRWRGRRRGRWTPNAAAARNTGTDREASTFALALTRFVDSRVDNEAITLPFLLVVEPGALMNKAEVIILTLVMFVPYICPVAY